MDYNQIIKYFLSTSAITAGIIYLAKLIFDKFFESRIEKYKSSLEKDTVTFKHKLNLEAETFRQELNKTSFEHQIKYSKLYEERGQIIKEIYNLLTDLENSLSNLTTPWQGPDWTNDNERDKKATISIETLRTNIAKNRIFFSVDLCEKIEAIVKDSHAITVEMSIAKSGERRNEKFNKQGIRLDAKELLKPSDTWHELDEKVQKEIKAARLNLEEEFRLLIGVS
jgi:Zn-dependent oligopeptidase